MLYSRAFAFFSKVKRMGVKEHGEGSSWIFFDTLNGRLHDSILVSKIFSISVHGNMWGKVLKVDKLERDFWQKKIVNDEIWFQKKNWQYARRISPRDSRIYNLTPNFIIYYSFSAINPFQAYQLSRLFLTCSHAYFLKILWK